MHKIVEEVEEISMNRCIINHMVWWVRWCLLLSVIVAGRVMAKRPNVIFIIVDDSEFIEYGCYGGRTLTPHIDSLAQNGVLFTHGFTSSSVCTPTRYACLSGQYASRAQSLAQRDQQPDHMSRFVRWNTDMESGGWNIASVLQKSGYTTGIVGKWHVGHGEHYWTHRREFKQPQRARKEPIPLDDVETNAYLRKTYDLIVTDMKQNFGFDYVASYYAGNLTGWPKAYDNFTKHNQDWVTAGALRFIDENANQEKPFFLYLSTTLQHGPPPEASIEADRRITMAGLLETPPKVQPGFQSLYQRCDRAGLPRDRAPYLWLDDGVGAVLERLRDHNIERNTIVFFFADQQSWCKGSCFDGGVNTPYLMCWPAGIPAGQVCEELVSNIDFAPTIFDICQVTPPADMHLDGQSFLPLVQGKQTQWRDAVFFELGNMRAVRTKHFKYIAIRRYTDEQWAQLPEAIQQSQEFRRRYFRLSQTWAASSAEHLQRSAIAKWRHDHAKYAEDSDQLYDLRVDPSENVNLVDNQEYARELLSMKLLLKDWLTTMPGPYGEFKKTF